MNILILGIYSLHRTIGGAESHLHGISSQLVRLGHTPVIVTTEHQDGLATSQLGSVQIVHLESRGYHVGWWGETIKKVPGICKSKNIDILHIHGGAGLALLKYGIDIPTVITFHGSTSDFVEYHLRELFLNPIQGLYHIKRLASLVHEHYIKYKLHKAYRDVPRLISVSESNKHDLKWTNLLREEQITVISPGVDTELFKPGYSEKVMAYRQTLNIHSGEKVLLSPGRFVSEKGISHSIKAFAIVLHDFPNSHLVLVGDGPERENLLALTKKLKLDDRVHFIGPVKYSEMAALYNLADIVLVPSLFKEPFGLVSAEAMSCSKPVVGYDIGAIREVVGSKSGVLVRRGRYRLLAREITKLLKFPDRMRELGKIGRQRVMERYDICITVEKLLSIYQAEIKNFRST